MIDPLADIDWNVVWKAQMLRSREACPARECARVWESRESAQRFWDMSQEERWRVEKTLEWTDTRSDSRVLDIGAGPGALALPFAQRVAHVTAVEPAAGMVSILKEKMAEQGIQNISIVQKLWERVDLRCDLQPPYDVVIASFSLGMLDIRAAIEKMIAASSHYIYLYHFAGPTSWDRQWKELWPYLHGREYQPGPKCDVLYNVLYQMGIYPHVHTFPLVHSQRYSSLEEAVAELLPQAQAQTEEQRGILREYLKRTLREEPGGKGGLVLPQASMRVKMWWEVGA